MALFALLLLQFGSLAAVFAAAALLLRYAYVLGDIRVNGREETIASKIFDPPTICIVPVGLAAATGQEGRAMTHCANKAAAGASTVLYGPDALRILALHVVEAAVGAALLRTCGGRSVAPFVPAAGNATGGSGPGGSGGDGGEIELVVDPGDILWYIVWPYCAGLAMLTLLVAVEKWGDKCDAIRPKICTCRPNARTPKSYFWIISGETIEVTEV